MFAHSDIKSMLVVYGWFSAVDDLRATRMQRAEAGSRATSAPEAGFKMQRNKNKCTRE